MRHKKIRDIVFFSIVSAILLILMITGLGYLYIGTFAYVTILHIPVLVGAYVLGKKYGALLGFVFGITSMIYAFILLGENAPFTNPLLSVLPRIIFGFLVYPIYNLFKKLFKDKEILSLGVSFAVCTFLHTIMVVFVLYLVGKSGFFFYSSGHPYTIDANILKFMLSCFTINSLIEVLLAVFVGTPIAYALNRIMNRVASETFE